MLKKKQTQDNNATDVTKNSSIEPEINSLILKAKKLGYSRHGIMNCIKDAWDNVIFIEMLPEENEEEKEFRRKTEIFIEKIYNEFLAYARVFRCLPYSGASWEYFDEELNDNDKKKFIIEVASNIYKAFEMDFFDRNELKDITVKRLKILFPKISSPVSLYKFVLSELLGYVEFTETSRECEEMLETYCLPTKYDGLICKFVWMVENT